MQTKNKNQISNEVLVLKYMRIQSGHSLKSAGRLFNIHSTAISHIENGKMLLPAQRIEQMVNGYGFTMQDFFKMSRASTPPTDLLTDCIHILKKLGRRRLPKAHAFLNELAQAHPSTMTTKRVKQNQ